MEQPARKTGRKRDPCTRCDHPRSGNRRARGGGVRQYDDGHGRAPGRKPGRLPSTACWASKADMVRDALLLMNRKSLELDKLPDTGTLRGDLLAMLKPQSVQAREAEVSSDRGPGLILFPASGFRRHWKSRSLRALDDCESHTHAARSPTGRISANADVETACLVAVSMAAFRGVIQSKPMDKRFFS